MRIVQGEGLNKPETFDFLGFTHIAGIRPRRQVSAQAPNLTEEEARQARAPHGRKPSGDGTMSSPEQHAWMCSVLDGHYRYYGVPTNSRAWRNSRYAVKLDVASVAATP